MMKKLIVAGAILVSVLAYGDNPPPPPGPEGWAFRRELAEDPPPDYAPPTGQPWLENRISRCFFAPIKRPPFFRDELMDDIDYYPDNYLERLRREGVNGLWLSFALHDMDEASLAKLGRTVAKCAAHGIKVWAFCIEPRNRPHDDPFYLAHPDARGAKTWDGNYVNCPSSPAVLGEIEELVARIFRAVPGLAGMINIANGERATTCLSFAPARVDRPKIPCAKCSKREPWELYAEVANAMVRGMRKGNPEARLISWFYQPEPSPTRGSWVYECARHAPEGVEFQFNFESGAVREQVGKTRIGGDYWLSFPGPAAPFERVAEVSREAGKPLSAKIQTSCSHECATVPYVPVPGLLYRKFRGMRAAGVRDVMMCWYFGNAPGLMNRAAGLLAYEDFKDGEDPFLERLAKDEWGEDAAVMGGLWRKFSDAYSHYPLSNDMQYYGPFHAGFSWPLYPSVSMRSLQRTWKPLETPGGDLIGECLADFSLEDAFACTDRMVRELDGVRPTLAHLRTKYANDRSRRRDLGIMVTLMDLFESARDIFRFYIVRRDGIFASRTDGDSARALACIGEMKDIIARERGRSEEMIPLCADDSRLGFHSEAQAHQFTADYLRWRIGELARADAELRTIERDLKAGKAWPESERERTAKVIRAEELADGSLVISGTCPELAEGQEMELRTYDLCGTAHARVYEARPEKGTFRVTLPAADWAADARLRPAWAVIRQGHDYNNGGTTWAHPDLPMFPEPRLHQDALTGDNFARIRPVRGRGALVLTFDDPRYDDWIRQIPLFERYGAHATFFPCGHIGTNEVAKLKRLAAAGHSIGIHTEHHRDADRAFSEEGAHMFMRDEINPQLKACTDAGLGIRYLAYPNNRHTPETDGYLAGAFRRFRAGVKGMTGYHTNGTSIVTLDRAFFPVADLPKHRVMEGTGVGAYYSTDIDDLCRGIRRAAERDEVLVLFSHDISENPGRVGMRTEWLEKLLATAKDCGVAVKGFDELGPVDPQVPQGPKTIYLTFDDGVGEHLYAAAELEKRGWRGIFCVVADWIGGDGKLTWDDVRELHRRGHVIANHTKTHRGLGNLWKQGLPDEVRKEILGGADAIERETGARPKLLCLPGTSGHGGGTKTAAELGETTMLVPRHCFGEWPHASGDVIDRLRANGQRQADFLVHGVSAAGGGWRPFATREDFIRYLDGIKAAEDAGKVAVTADYALKP